MEADASPALPDWLRALRDEIEDEIRAAAPGTPGREALSKQLRRLDAWIVSGPWVRP